MPAGSNVAEEPSATSGDDAKGHGEQASVESAETQIANDDGAKGDETAVGDVDDDVEEEDEPDLDIEERLEDLVPLPNAVGDTSTVGSQTLGSVVPLLRSEEAGVHGAVGEDEEEEQAVGDVDGAGDDVQILPLEQGSRAGDLADDEGEEAVEYGRDVRKDD